MQGFKNSDEVEEYYKNFLKTIDNNFKT